MKSQTEVLQERDQLVQQRNQELADVNGQLKDLQGLFDEVGNSWALSQDRNYELTW